MALICPRCHHRNEDGARACANCGVKFNIVQSSSHGQSRSGSGSKGVFNSSVPYGDHPLAVTALVLGIVGIVLAFVPFANYVALAGAIFGLVCAVICRKKQSLTGRKTSLATAGFVLTIIAVSLCGIGCIVSSLTCVPAICKGCSLCRTVRSYSSDLSDLSDIYRYLR